jgi:DNA invertase Pin-like site-specific DNA recombinase
MAMTITGGLSKNERQHVQKRTRAAMAAFAQQHGYFASIAYRSVVDLANPDRAVATAAVQQLRDDLEAGFDHLLMARVSSVDRAKEVLKSTKRSRPI